MAVYAYKAVDAELRSVRGTVVADTPRLAREQLLDRGLTVQELTTAIQKRSGSFGLEVNRRSRIASFIRELSTLLGAGIPLLDALDSIAELQRDSFKTAILLVRDRVAAGMGLADAMA